MKALDSEIAARANESSMWLDKLMTQLEGQRDLTKNRVAQFNGHASMFRARVTAATSGLERSDSGAENGPCALAPSAPRQRVRHRTRQYHITHAASSRSHPCDPLVRRRPAYCMRSPLRMWLRSVRSQVVGEVRVGVGDDDGDAVEVLGEFDARGEARPACAEGGGAGGGHASASAKVTWRRGASQTSLLQPWGIECWKHVCGAHVGVRCS